MTRNIIILFSLFLMTACEISIKDKDLLSYNIYKVHDTLAFKNAFGQIDKFEILSKTIINKGWDANTGWYNPQVAYVKYKDLTKPDSIYYDNSFLTIYQRNRNEIEETIYFKGFIGSINRKMQRTKEFMALNQEDIFKVPSFDMTTVRDSRDLTYIYWNDKVGIIGYDYKNGDRWVLAK